ncbi:MAG: adenylate cyclase [Gammaproteobacteria bacterium]
MRWLKAFMAWRWRAVVVAAAIVIFVLYLVGELAAWYGEAQPAASSDADRSSSPQGNVPPRKTSIYTPNVDAYDLYVRGRTMATSSEAKSLAVAVELFNSAIEADSQFAGGYAGASQTRLAQYRLCSDSCEHHLDAALKMGRKAVDLDPSFAAGVHYLAEALYLSGEFETALATSRKVIEIDPSDALVRASYGRILGYSGKLEEGLQQVEEAFNTGSDKIELLYELGAMYRFGGQFDEAIKALREHRRRLRGRMLPSPTAQLAAAYMQDGRIMEARSTIQVLRRNMPRFSIQHALRSHRFASEQATETYSKALRDSGLRDN